MNFYPHHIGDFNNATRHLTRIERSVYRDMIDLYYDTEEPLTLDVKALCRKLIARTDEESTAVQQVLSEFFTETEQGWHHSRCESEISAYRASITAKSAAGKASAAKREQERLERLEKLNGSPSDDQQPLDSVDSSVQLTSNQEPVSINQEPKEDEKPNPPAARSSRPAKPAGGKVTSICAAGLIALGVDEDVASEFLAIRKAKRAPLTDIALAGIKREAGHLGWTLDETLRKCVERGWQGFEAGWITGNKQQSTQRPTTNADRNADWNARMSEVLSASSEPQRQPMKDMGTIDATV